jgi:hypothetical protein
MPFYIKNSGAFSILKKAFVKNSGTWSEVKAIWIKNGGVWTKSFVNETTVNVASQNNINLKTLYTNQTGAAPSSAVRVIYNINGNIGSTSSTIASLVTDTWPAGSEIFVNIGAGVYVAGKGGNSGVAGGNAISLGYSITIVNSGVIAGGGGGGGGATYSSSTAHGGAGAGLIAGTRGDGATATLTTATAGTTFTYVQFVLGSNRTFTVNGGTGGTLAAAGSAYNQTGGTPNSYPTPYAAGAAGRAIVLNGNTATRSGSGSTIGTVS